jgi:hypothetical protein
MSPKKLTEPQLLAELVAVTVQDHIGSVGVIVRDVGSPDAETLLKRLKQLHDEEQPELRVAYLHDDVAMAAKAAGFGKDLFSTDVEQAERWRNERDLTALIVVIAAGDEAKLSSLEDFGSITSKDLKRALVARALEGPAGENDVQLEWWAMLRADDSIGLGQLADYFLALDGKKGEQFKSAASRELHRLGLLPDSAFFDSPKPAALRKRLLDNRELVQRLQTLTPKDRRTIKGVVEQEKNADQKTHLRKALDQLHRTRWEGKGMGALDFEAAERLIKARTKKKTKKTDGDEDEKPKKTTERAAEVAADALVDPDREDDLDEVLEEMQKSLRSVDDTSVRTEKVRTPLSSSSVEVTTTARLDVINLVAKLLDDGLYGGLLKSESDEINAILRRFNAQEDIVKRWERDEIRTVLEHLAEGSDAGGELIDLFRTYDEARTAVLPYMRALAAEPLVVAANKKARKTMLASIQAYEALTNGLWSNYDEIFETVGPDIEELLTSILLLDLIVISGGPDGSKVFTILSPVHPLYLWHHGMYADIVETQRDSLPEKDKELVAVASAQLPNFLTSIFVPAPALGTGIRLNAAGRLGALPYYAKDVESNSSEDGIDSVENLISAYISLEPHAQWGFRLALIDPPAVGSYLRSIIDLKEAGVLSGAHVVVFRRRGGAMELRLDEDDEDRVAQAFRALSMDRRFTFEVREISGDDLGPTEDEPFHLAVVFDRSHGRANRSRPALHPIQPLAMPRRLQYSQVHKTVELEPAPGGLFQAYNKVVGRVAEGGRSSYLAVHQQDQLRDSLQELATKMSWVAIADRQVDRDLSLGALRVFTAREGERDVAAFAQSPSAFRRPLREVARGYNAYVTDEELDGLLQQLSELLDQGLLNLKPDHTGRTNHSRIKGLLGTLIAARWFRDAGADGTRLLVSLDSADARRWMHLSDDPLRADLVGLEWTNDHCTVSVIEVKAVQASASEYKIDDGKATGSAVEQMLATRRLLTTVLSPDQDQELITTPARREVLREHFYRELTKGTYSAEERKLWSDRLQRLLDGEVKAEVRCHLIDVRLGVDAESLQERSVVATDGEVDVPTQITELNEVGIEVLKAKEGVEPPDEDAEDEDGGGSDAPEPGTPPDHDSPVEEAEPEPADEAEPEAESAQEVPEEPVADAPKVSEPAKSSTPEPEAAAGDVGRPRALLGSAPGKYGKPRDVWFDPASPEDPLPNPHISITGETGSGKTQATKAIISDLQQQGLPVLVLDFKDDYADETYAEAEGFRVYDASYDPLPFNPLMPSIDSRNRVNPAHHIHQLSDIVKRIYKLGDQQAYRFREAVKAAYEESGLGTKATVVTDETVFPPFDAVKKALAGDKGNEALLGRLSPIFDLGLFESSDTEQELDEFLQSNVVVRLGQLPGDETKNSVAEFFLMALYNFLVRKKHSHKLDRLLILDEAWRLVESPFMIPLMREGRAFGLGVVIATQFPKDLPEAVAGSTATRLFFSQSQVEQVREVQRTVVGKTSGSEADHVASVMRSLSPLTSILYSKQYEQFVRLAIKPYFERRAEREGSDPAA